MRFLRSLYRFLVRTLGALGLVNALWVLGTRLWQRGFTEILARILQFFS